MPQCIFKTYLPLYKECIFLLNSRLQFLWGNSHIVTAVHTYKYAFDLFHLTYENNELPNCYFEKMDNMNLNRTLLTSIITTITLGPAHNLAFSQPTYLLIFILINKKDVLTIMKYMLMLYQGRLYIFTIHILFQASHIYVVALNVLV